MLFFLKKYTKFFLWGIFSPILIYVFTQKKTKIIVWRVDRFGHLALNTHLFLIRQKLSLNKEGADRYMFLAPRKNISNAFLFNMFVEYIRSNKFDSVLTSNFLYYLAQVFKTDLEKTKILYQMEYKSREKEFSLGVKTVDFGMNHKEKAESILLKMNIHPNDKVVSVYARDSSFLTSVNGEEDWGYHDYRDSDIGNYLKAIKHLIKLGYKVVRIGSQYSKSLNYESENYIEYNLSGFKSDFMDVYLASRSEFIVGSRSGATDVSLIFGTPLLVVNSTTFMESPLGKKDLFIQKKIQKKNEVLNFKDIIDKEEYYLFSGLELKNKFNMEYIENTENEILHAVIEMNNKLNGEEYDTDQKKLLNRYFNEFCNRNKWSNRNAPISIGWLQENYSSYL